VDPPHASCLEDQARIRKDGGYTGRIQEKEEDILHI